MNLSRTCTVLLLCLSLLAGAAWGKDSVAETPGVPEAVLSADIPINELTLRLTPLTVDELAVTAEAWRGIVKTKTEELVEAQITAQSEAGDTAIADSARERLGALAEQRRALFERYSTVVDSWEKKGGDEAAIAAYPTCRNCCRCSWSVSSTGWCWRSGS